MGLEESIFFGFGLEGSGNVMGGGRKLSPDRAPLDGQSSDRPKQDSPNTGTRV